jgi:hypothetical protein
MPSSELDTSPNSRHGGTMAQAEYVPSAICALIPDASAQPSTSPSGAQRLMTYLLAQALRSRQVIALLIDLRFPRTGGLQYFAEGPARRAG